ncbi:hypothetical protein HPP92_019295 [Vanilla planifolia]|uniref:PTM/DIR17-like Tudor domain-containing protein n=1 Tax=Vanilla planifolia TaxID=51239 RepID=A0A835UMS2_VANPL|nr:hypothetical protein HPP92_019295 [Vanilla planifolia]
METIHGHNACGSRHANDPYFGEWLEGRKVKKLYKHQYHLGEVVKYDPQINCYMVVYEDGNSEDLQWDELKEVLLPLDINIPLKLLALQRCRHVKFFSDLKIASQMGKNNHVKSLMERTRTLSNFRLKEPV